MSLIDALREHRRARLAERDADDDREILDMYRATTPTETTP